PHLSPELAISPKDKYLDAPQSPTRTVPACPPQTVRAPDEEQDEASLTLCWTATFRPRGAKTDEKDFLAKESGNM
ncbi:MAG: hypothetical protein QGG53_13300, partial [Planctomycetota bacterium]|nr:hypothetical protein [Planctomycetota bacterium]